MSSIQQKVVLVCLYVSYLLHTYVKKSVTYAMPDIASRENLDNGQLGLILSIQLMSYAISKFICGMVIDSVSPKRCLALGLLTTGITAAAFASVESSVATFSFLWCLNGITNGVGWPASALIMKAWCRPDQFGTAWSVLSTSMNVSGMVGPLITAYIITQSGWRTSVAAPGAAAVMFSVVVYVLVHDKPDVPVGDDGKTRTISTDKEEAQSDEKISVFGLFLLPGYTGVCFTYGAISLVQFGTCQWAPVYLVNDLGHSIITGNSYISSLEFGGIVGSLLAGYCSDFLLTKRPYESISRIRQFVIAWFAVGLATCLLCLTYCVTKDSSVIWINIIGFCLGLTIYGPVAIFGVVAMESAPSHLAGRAHAVASLFANGGQSLSGLPLSYIAKGFGWQATFLLQSLLVTQVAAYLFFYTIYTRKRASVDTDKKQS